MILALKFGLLTGVARLFNRCKQILDDEIFLIDTMTSNEN
jgi:hypothetical protein